MLFKLPTPRAGATRNTLMHPQERVICQFHWSCPCTKEGHRDKTTAECLLGRKQQDLKVGKEGVLPGEGAAQQGYLRCPEQNRLRADSGQAPAGTAISGTAASTKGPGQKVLNETLLYPYPKGRGSLKQ